MATVLFVTPHQDDETLSMGPAIRLHIEAGHEVHVLCLTDGAASGARAITGLTVPEFVQARDDELFRACRALGVQWANIHKAEPRLSDGSLTAVQAADAIYEFLDDHPGAWIKTYSDLAASGRHTDHLASGAGARLVYNAGDTTNLRFYVEPWLVSAFQSAHPGVALGTEHPAYPAWVLRALDEYTMKDSTGKRYGIGQVSVPSQIAGVRANPVSRNHLP